MKHVIRLINHERERVCDMCGHVAKTPDYLETHKQVKHFGLKGFKCEHDDCDKQFSLKKYLIKHMKTHNTSQSFQCNMCDFKTHLQENLERHTMRQHVDKLTMDLNCDGCDYVAPNKDRLQTHKRNYHKHERNPFSCDQCAFVGSNYPFLYSHKNKIHNGVKYHCDLCEHVSYNETLLKHHMKQNHPDHEPVVYEHQKTTFKVEDYPRCEPCNKLFQTRKRYLNHNKEKHSETGGLQEVKNVTAPIRKKQIKRVKCPTCDKDFTSERRVTVFYLPLRRVERNIIIKHNTPVQCTKCDENFTDRKLLLEPKNNVHKQGSVTNCEQCGKEM